MKTAVIPAQAGIQSIELRLQRNAGKDWIAAHCALAMTAAFGHITMTTRMTNCRQPAGVARQQ